MRDSDLATEQTKMKDTKTNRRKIREQHKQARQEQILHSIKTDLCRKDEHDLHTITNVTILSPSFDWK
jgi:hypothetical protein